MSETAPKSVKKKSETCYSCIVCQKKFIDQETAQLCTKKHLLNWDEKGESMYCCCNCKQTFAEFELAHDCFVSHLSEKPSNKLVYRCLVCKKHCANEHSLQSCYRYHYCLSSEDEQKFQCPVCKSNFNTIVAAHNCFLGHTQSTAEEPDLGKEELPSKSEKKSKKLTASHCSICKRNRRSAALANECCAGEKSMQSLEKNKIIQDSSVGLEESLSETRKTESSGSKMPLAQPTSIISIESDRKYFANQCCVCGKFASSQIAAKQCCSGRLKKDKRNVHFAKDFVTHNTAYRDYYDDDLQEELNVVTDENNYDDDPDDAQNDNGQQVVSSKRKRSADNDGDFVTGSEFKKLKWEIAELAKQKQENHRFTCSRCDRIFNDRTDWRQHDIMCIVSSGLMESSAMVRQSVIDTIVGRWPKETALAIMAKVARDGSNGPLHIDETSNLKQICALTESVANVSSRIEELPQTNVKQSLKSTNVTGEDIVPSGSTIQTGSAIHTGSTIQTEPTGRQPIYIQSASNVLAQSQQIAVAGQLPTRSAPTYIYLAVPTGLPPQQAPMAYPQHHAQHYQYPGSYYYQ